MQAILLVGLGGFLGSVARYGLASCAERYELIGPEARLFLFTGLLGGFTTFSAFGLEATNLIRRGDLGTAALYVGGSVSLGLIAVGLGLWVVSLLPR